MLGPGPDLRGRGPGPRPPTNRGPPTKPVIFYCRSCHSVYKTDSLTHSRTALHWFESYLVGRRQHVHTPATFSSPTVIECGVPQGSVLGPILFLLYIADLQLFIEDRGLYPHHFADDTQICGFCSPTPSSCTELQSRISKCIDVVSGWMRSHRLQLNTAKTDRSHQANYWSSNASAATTTSSSWLRPNHTGPCGP